MGDSFKINISNCRIFTYLSNFFYLYITARPTLIKFGISSRNGWGMILIWNGSISIFFSVFPCVLLLFRTWNGGRRGGGGGQHTAISFPQEQIFY